ncbi:hypothetical protein BD410DRAFT_844335 [Rickenella mellea]|uniref:Tubulin-specific chaperone A n=1 Tax=Rickenella mellea TaxID=50990 RepID=A0A4Y7PNA9_9AGAM|nr:hypothetical protein BD410DRAFT_844335 [Rickenella mellea]
MATPQQHKLLKDSQEYRDLVNVNKKAKEARSKANEVKKQKNTAVDAHHADPHNEDKEEIAEADEELYNVYDELAKGYITDITVKETALLKKAKQICENHEANAKAICDAAKLAAKA